VGVYHATGNMGVPLFTSVKCVLTVHDLIPLEIKNYFDYSKLPWLSKLIYNFRLKSSCKKAIKIISVSEYTKRQLIKLGIQANKIMVIRSGVNNIMKEITKRYVLDDYILNNGGIDIRKNLNGLIGAFAKVHKNIPNLKLVITGENRRQVADLKKLVISLNLIKTVIFTGYVSEEKMSSLIKYAKCLCYPSFAEGFGSPVLEAFSFGIPVISSNTTSIPELAEGAAILVNPGEEKEISDAIMKIIIDDSLANKLRKQGLIRVKGFTWEKTANEYIDLYNHI
jgi:glycosyltransferase involved in cell wall biosynthesis